MVTGDLDGDGRTDLVVLGAGGDLRERLDGAPAALAITLPSVIVDGLAIADLDDDGADDRQRRRARDRHVRRVRPAALPAKVSREAASRAIRRAW